MTTRIVPLVIVLAIVAIGAWFVSSYNTLVALDQGVQAQWGQVENVYQRRADLIPNLVATVKGVANFEKSTYIAVAQARAKVGQVTIRGTDNLPTDAAALAKYQAAQDGLSSALSRLLAVVENYPDLKSNENFLELQSQLEGTENRIAVERMRYNSAAQKFNTMRLSFPMTVIAGMFGDKFKEKAYFQATSGAETAPKVQF
ncbi:MAG: LemA family protein [Candidatus Eremiobacterales bacterium]|jgi:LemA protein